MSFFESLGIAGAERIHTQMVAWILTECQAYTQASKSAIICNMFHIKPERHFDHIECHTEFKNIDLLIRADSFLGALENKLKSTQRVNQLTDYWAIINSARTAYFPDALKPVGILFALTNEPPGDPNWRSTSYVDFLVALQRQPMVDPAAPHTVILREYIGTLERLTNAVTDFCENHQQYPEAFRDGAMKNFDRTRQPVLALETAHYIRSFGLETILQMTFLRALLADMHIPANSVAIAESHATAFFEIPLRTIHYRGKDFSLGFQFQGKTVKFNIGGRPYEKSTPAWIDETLRNAFAGLVAAAGYPGGLNIGRKRAYLSGSVNLKHDVHAYTRPELADLLRSAYLKARDVALAWNPPQAPA